MQDIEIKPAWRLQNAEIEEDAVAFWDRYNLLPLTVGAAERARELCAVAYRNGELVAVATAAIGILPVLRAKFAMFRCAVAPQHRLSGVAPALITYCRELLEKWSAEHPEEGVMGMVAILEGYKGDTSHLPVWPVTRLTLIGYTPQGHQIRVAWFPHARVE